MKIRMHCINGNKFKLKHDGKKKGNKMINVKWLEITARLKKKKKKNKTKKKNNGRK